MINQKFNIFAYPSFLRAVAIIGYSPVTVWKNFSALFPGFFIIFVIQWFKVIAPHQKFATAQIQKSDFSKYKQREHPSNDQLPSTRQGLHSIPDNPVRTKGVVLDCTLSIACCKLKAIQLSLMGMKDREVMFNC